MRAKVLKTSFMRSWLCFEQLFLQGELEGAGGGYISHRMKLPIPADVFYFAIHGASPVPTLFFCAGSISEQKLIQV